MPAVTREEKQRFALLNKVALTALGIWEPSLNLFCGYGHWYAHDNTNVFMFAIDDQKKMVLGRLQKNLRECPNIGNLYRMNKLNPEVAQTDKLFRELYRMFGLFVEDST